MHAPISFLKSPCYLAVTNIYTPPILLHNCHLPANAPGSSSSPPPPSIPLSSLSSIIETNNLLLQIPNHVPNSSWSFFASWIHLFHHVALLNLSARPLLSKICQGAYQEGRTLPRGSSCPPRTTRRRSKLLFVQKHVDSQNAQNCW